jgi:hypothetical protein
MASTQVICDNSVDITDLDHANSRAKPHSHKALQKLSRREKEAKVVNAVSRELSSKEFNKKLQNFKPSGGLQQKEIRCTTNQVSVKFSSPLNGISQPHYIKRWKCEDLISEEGESGNPGGETSSVVAVKLNWKRGVKVEQISRYSQKTRNIEPDMTTTDFDFESKMKFQKQLQSVRDELFHNMDVIFLDGNECHGRITMKAKQINEDEETEDISGGDSSNLPHSAFLDQEEHLILVVPFYSKSGFDIETERRYNFPYHAKFVVGKKTFEHKFELRLALAQQPQHFGLIFTFPDGQGKLTIKSLITIYSVFPSSTKYANLITYTSHESDDNSSRTKSNKLRKSFGKNVNETVSENLKEENLNRVGRYGRDNVFQIGCDIAHPNQMYSEFTRYKSSLEEADSKHKQKQRLLKNMKAEAREFR